MCQHPQNCFQRSLACTVSYRIVFVSGGVEGSKWLSCAWIPEISVHDAIFGGHSSLELGPQVWCSRCDEPLSIESWTGPGVSNGNKTCATCRIKVPSASGQSRLAFQPRPSSQCSQPPAAVIVIADDVLDRSCCICESELDWVAEWASLNLCCHEAHLGCAQHSMLCSICGIQSSEAVVYTQHGEPFDVIKPGKRLAGRSRSPRGSSSV